MRYAIGFALLLQTLLPAQPPAQAGVASAEKVDLKGTVVRVSAAPGQGMPSLDMKSGQETVTITLGSMRYLLQNDFNPKAGDTIAVKGYKMKEGVLAIEVTLGSGKPLAFRDNQGRPMWSGGVNGRQGRMGRGRAEK
ncbi:MAG: hypothetical protein IH602_17665 [Bryobacteraceae bacterium]|nr:hypothetical protein [Bryobacteraceae bacterium]